MRNLLLLIVLLFLINLSAEWTVVETFIVPEGAAGLAWDGEFLYCGIYGVNGDYFYQIDPADGSHQFIFSVPNLGDCFGLTYDGEYLWTTDHPSPSSNPALAYQIDMNGNIISQFNLPDHYMSGIAFDEGDFWVSTYYDPDGYIYKLDAEGNILQEFTAPDNQPWDLCMENDNLWMADYWGDALYKIDPTTGETLESNPSEGVDPSGIVFDGEFLWYCDNGQGTAQDYLYKVDIGNSQSGLLEGWVVDENGLPMEGVMINVDNITFFTDIQGYFQAYLMPGVYEMEASFQYYNSMTMEIVIISGETTTITVSLEPAIMIFPPENLTIDAHGFIQFEAPNALEMEFYNIYLNGELLEEITSLHYLIRGLEVGSMYTIGISAEYSIWESDIVTVEFTPSFSHDYGDVDDNDIVEAFDASLTLRYAVGMDPGNSAPLPWEFWRKYVADSDGNAEIDAYDGALILQYVVGIIDVFPGDHSIR